MAAPSLVFWDWNGTLMDDAAYSCGCLNGLLDEYGYPQRYDLDAYRSVFGFPIEDYYRRVGFDFGRDPFPLLAESYMQRYNAGVDACPLTEGAAGVIRALAGRGIGQALLSVSRRDYLAQQAARRGDYHYNYVGVALCLLHLPFRWRNRYFCSQFVAELLSASGAVSMRKAPSLYLPNHFPAELDGACQVVPSPV